MNRVIAETSSWADVLTEAATRLPGPQRGRHLAAEVEDVGLQSGGGALGNRVAPDLLHQRRYRDHALRSDREQSQQLARLSCRGHDGLPVQTDGEWPENPHMHDTPQVIRRTRD